MGTKYHPHKYILIDNRMWKCALDCTWGFLWKGGERALLGKPAVCWGCNEVFIMDMGNLMQEKPTCYNCSPMAKIEPINPLTGVPTPVKLNTPTYDTAEPVMTREQIQSQYEVFKSVAGAYAADNWRNAKLDKLAEFERAQAIHAREVQVEEDKPESEYIPPKYDVE